LTLLRCLAVSRKKIVDATTVEAAVISGDCNVKAAWSLANMIYVAGYKP
jgi:hypothetical protein